LTSRILRYRTVTTLAFATLSATLLLSACEPNNPAPAQASKPAADATPSAAATPEQPVTPALKELDAQARKAKLTQARLCNIETVDGAKPTAEATFPADVTSVAFTGWIGDETTGKRPENARLLLQTLNRSRAWEQSVGDAIMRKDVAKAVNIPTLEDGGFKVTVDLSGLPIGEYRVMLLYGNGDQSFICDNGRRVTR
jgi:hypothetical protein